LDLIANGVIHSTFTAPCILISILSGEWKKTFGMWKRICSNPTIFNPITYSWLLQNKCVGQTLFTPTLCWGSYLLAFNNAPQYKTYVGCDTSTGIIQTCKSIPTNKSVQLLHCPPENIATDEKIIFYYQNYFDTVLFNVEESEKWSDIVKGCKMLLKKGGVFAFTASDLKIPTLTTELNQVCMEDSELKMREAIPILWKSTDKMEWLFIYVKN
jgi:hypothetical protein